MIRRSGPVMTTSARQPDSRAPIRGSPSTVAGVVAAARTASTSGTPPATVARTTSSRWAVPPAMAPPSVSRATPSVTVTGGVARLTHGGAIAGGTAHLLDVLRTTVAGGVPLVDAVRSAATTPATVLGDPRVGALETGRRADVLVTDQDLRIIEVRRAGRLVHL